MKPFLQAALKKAIPLVVSGLLLGWGYEWSATRLYQEEETAGFWRGTLHGALMPAAMPSLLLGKDVPIFAPRNSGRGYKLGYIAGINLCGLVFFGLTFRSTGRPNAKNVPATEAKEPEKV
jgi:hypothetical protein